MSLELIRILHDHVERRLGGRPPFRYVYEPAPDSTKLRMPARGST